MNDAHLMTTDDVVETVPIVWAVKVAGQKVGMVEKTISNSPEFRGIAFVNNYRRCEVFYSQESARDWVVKTSQEEK